MTTFLRRSMPQITRWILWDRSPSTVMLTWCDGQESRSCRWARNPSRLKWCVAQEYLRSSHCRPQALLNLNPSWRMVGGIIILQVFQRITRQVCLTSSLSLLLGHSTHLQGSSSVHLVRAASKLTDHSFRGSALTAANEVWDELRIHLLYLTNLRIFQLRCLTGSLLLLLLTLSYLKCRDQLNTKVSIICHTWQAFNK